jgi:hypothetical protein
MSRTKVAKALKQSEGALYQNPRLHALSPKLKTLLLRPHKF